MACKNGYVIRCINHNLIARSSLAASKRARQALLSSYTNTILARVSAFRSEIAKYELRAVGIKVITTSMVDNWIENNLPGAPVVIIGDGEFQRNADGVSPKQLRDHLSRVFTTFVMPELYTSDRGPCFHRLTLPKGSRKGKAHQTYHCAKCAWIGSKDVSACLSMFLLFVNYMVTGERHAAWC